MSIYRLPTFSGWRLLGSDKIRVGDVFVNVEDHYGKYKTPETGDPAGGTSINQPANRWLGTGWAVYRKSDGKSIPRRIVMHRAFSQPLPLP